MELKFGQLIAQDKNEGSVMDFVIMATVVHSCNNVARGSVKLTFYHFIILKIKIR